MIGDITLGQYYPANSFIHRMDARMKTVLMISMIVFIFLTKSVPSMLLTAAATLFFVLLSRVPLKMFLKSLRAIIFLVLFTSVLNLFYFPGEPLWSWWKLTITYEGVRQSCFIALRLISLITISSILTFTSTPTELTGAIESLLSPLRLVGVRVHELAMLMTIALRFVPTLLEEAQKIMSAQKARGADIESGGLVKRVKALVPILIPLFVSAFRRAYDLALAMETRCYTDGKGRTRLNQMRLGWRDMIALLFSAGICFTVIALNKGPYWRDILTAAPVWANGIITSLIKK